MNIRLTYCDKHVPNWLLQQMICLERLDARALQLPFEIIPSLELSKGMFSTMRTGLVFLLPYLLSMHAGGALVRVPVLVVRGGGIGGGSNDSVCLF